MHAICMVLTETMLRRIKSGKEVCFDLRKYDALGNDLTESMEIQPDWTLFHQIFYHTEETKGCGETRCEKRRTSPGTVLCSQRANGKAVAQSFKIWQPPTTFGRFADINPERGFSQVFLPKL
jgi:hypothetical protein